jgi:pullulanase/glycogen debranching enzyme
MTGTVISELLPVTTPMMLVAKNKTINKISALVDKNDMLSVYQVGFFERRKRFSRRGLSFCDRKTSFCERKERSLTKERKFLTEEPLSVSEKKRSSTENYRFRQ